MRVNASARRRASWRMTATVEIRRFTGEYTLDPVTAEETPEYAVVYSGMARIKSQGAMTSESDVAGGIVTKAERYVHLPVGSYRACVDDEVRVIADSNEPLNAGMVLRLREGAPAQSQATAYRIWATVVTGNVS